MNIPRRDFLKTSLAASAATAVSATHLHAAAPASAAAGREYYELRCYTLKMDRRLKANAPQAPLDAYLEKTFLPALDRRGVKNVGVFTELDVDKRAVTSKPKADSPVWVLVPHATFDSFVSVSADLNADAEVQKSGAAYLQTPRASAPFERVDTWLLRAFKSLPKLEVPAFSRSRTATRVFEMRTYESYSEAKALAKMAMFDDGETQLMKDLGMAPVFFGQALAGKDLPHLTYITSGPDLKSHLDAWSKFGPDPRWIAMKDLPQYADSVSSNIPRFLAPTAYSQI